MIFIRSTNNHDRNIGDREGLLGSVSNNYDDGAFLPYFIRFKTLPELLLPSWQTHSKEAFRSRNLKQSDVPIFIDQGRIQWSSIPITQRKKCKL